MLARVGTIGLMNEQLTRTSGLASFIVVLAFCLLGCEPAPTPSNVYPYSILEGRTVKIMPYGATFVLPEAWISPTYGGKNLFLSRDELASISQPAWGNESRVMNSVLPFSDCAVHAGERGWGNGTVSDQARVYVLEMTPDEVATRIERDGLATSARAFDKAVFTAGSFGDWKHFTINYFYAPTHAFMFRDIDFYFRSFGDKTVVFVFLHSVGGTKYIPPILNSFEWKQNSENWPSKSL